MVFIEIIIFLMVIFLFILIFLIVSHAIGKELDREKMKKDYETLKMKKDKQEIPKWIFYLFSIFYHISIFFENLAIKIVKIT
jgi:NADH:ubiquinone oxidoreductase subunit 3 (subunit A)